MPRRRCAVRLFGGASSRRTRSVHSSEDLSFRPARARARQHQSAFHRTEHRTDRKVSAVGAGRCAMPPRRNAAQRAFSHAVAASPRARNCQTRRVTRTPADQAQKAGEGRRYNGIDGGERAGRADAATHTGAAAQLGILQKCQRLQEKEARDWGGARSIAPCCGGRLERAAANTKRQQKPL